MDVVGGVLGELDPGEEGAGDDVLRVEGLAEVLFVLVHLLVEVREETAVVTGVVVGVGGVFHHQGDVHAVLRFSLDSGEAYLLFEPDHCLLLYLFLPGEGCCRLAGLVVQVIDLPRRYLQLFPSLRGILLIPILLIPGYRSRLLLLLRRHHPTIPIPPSLPLILSNHRFIHTLQNNPQSVQPMKDPSSLHLLPNRNPAQFHEPVIHPIKLI